MILILQDSYDKNLKLYIQEGLKWMENKYGFKRKMKANH